MIFNSDLFWVVLSCSLKSYHTRGIIRISVIYMNYLDTTCSQCHHHNGFMITGALGQNIKPLWRGPGGYIVLILIYVGFLGVFAVGGGCKINPCLKLVTIMLET